jgi:glycine/D-amino acid oxidase-like deaminating enzyme/nitrite reductase/ring-hydroxylating ferredoxin subunit
MGPASTKTSSYWEESSHSSLRRNAVEEDLDADVCIVGAGIAGLSVGYYTARAGHRTVILDDGPPGRGQTCRTTAHLASAIDDRYTELERLHGEEGARLAAESHAEAISAIEAICRDERIACSFQRLDGYLFAPPNGNSDDLQSEYAAARRTGVLDVRWAERAPIAFDTGRCLVFHDQAQFHPLQYLEGLAQAILVRGGRIYSGTHVAEVAGGRAAQVVTEQGHTIRCRAVVVATNSPINDRFAIHTKQAPYTTYVVSALVPRRTVASALYWDTCDPYHYVRLQSLGAAQPDNELLIVGGEDHKSGQANDGHARFERLEQWARERFPSMTEVQQRWSGQVMETIDGLAFIGRNALDDDNVFIATGDSGMGMTHGTIAGILISALIDGRAHPWESLYDPARKTLRASARFLRENANVTLQYASLLTPGDVSDPEQIPAGEGAVMRNGLEKLAVHRSTDGQVSMCSAICPHLGCVVAWNAVEKTWDCPCHGSRFDAHGEVIVGPANTHLKARDVGPVRAAE